MRRREAARRLLLAAAACAAAGCSKRKEAPKSRAAPVAGDSEASRFELVFEREVNGNLDLYLIPAGGGAERRLTDAPGEDGLARWSPDGERILFTSLRTGNYQLYEVPAGGGLAKRLRTNTATEYQADYSPDGKQLAFLTNLGGPERLVLQDLATGGVRDLVNQGDGVIFGNPHWSPDGRKIVFSSNWRIGHQIYLLDTQSTQDARLSPVLGGGCEPRFSPDGRKVVYVSRGHHGDKSRLVEHDLESDKETVLVGWPALNYDPVYSPDGTELAFASNITGDWVIYRQRLSDGRSWRVTFGPGAARNPDYRPAP